MREDVARTWSAALGVIAPGVLALAVALAAWRRAGRDRRPPIVSDVPVFSDLADLGALVQRLRDESVGTPKTATSCSQTAAFTDDDSRELAQPAPPADDEREDT